MPWCPHCSGDRPGAAESRVLRSPEGRTNSSSFTSCSACGRVLDDSHRPLSSSSRRRSRPRCPSPLAFQVDPIDMVARSPPSGAEIIREIAAVALNINLKPAANDEDPSFVRYAGDFFLGAVHEDDQLSLFACKGRRARAQVAAACLYAALRRHRMPCMLIHLSDHLRVSVYLLASLFLALAKILRPHHQQERIFTDPCLFMHRISSRLLGREDTKVAVTALRILCRTSRGLSKKEMDPWSVWMLSTRKQIHIQICSAALYVAANAHEDDNARKFSRSEVVEAVRAEFEQSMAPGGNLIVQEFASRILDMSSKAKSKGGGAELLCRHSDGGRAHCGHGLCRECYDVFVEMSTSGVLGQSGNAFQSLKRQKIKHDEENPPFDLREWDVCEYINTEKEKQYRKKIWELMNSKYLEEQAIRRADASTGGNGAKPRKERKQRQHVDTGGYRGFKGTEGAEKNKSSRINYDVLSQLHEEGKGERTEENRDEHGGSEFDVGAVDSYDQGEGFAGGGDDEYLGDFEEDYGGGDYSAAGDEGFADDDFGF